MSCLQALLAKLRFEKAEPILKMHELQKVLGHIRATSLETCWPDQISGSKPG